MKAKKKPAAQGARDSRLLGSSHPPTSSAGVRSLRTFPEVYAALRRQNRQQYWLLAGCCFFSVLLITAYVCMMRSPTILDVLPEGGDSRKQVMMIFALTVVGCGVFTIYASGLFFRQKSREMGIFLALGVSKAQLRRELFRELALLAGSTCAAGALLGAPLALGLWQLFRLVVVDTQEMPLRFDPHAYALALGFSGFVMGMLFLMGRRFLRQTNIIDVVQQSHTAEAIHAVPRWYGLAGIGLTLGGAFLGYSMPSVFILKLHWYPPEVLTAVFYLPVLVGLYWVMLHTVVNGWGRGRNRYRHIISTSMMQFQGRQTVRNMLVMTLLIGGGYFGSFYLPMLGVGNMQGIQQRPVDYAYHYRADQNLPSRNEVEALAQQYGVSITAWEEQTGAMLGVDGIASIEKETPVGVTYTTEYRPVLTGCTFLSESAYTALTGRAVDVSAGSVVGIMDDEGSSGGRFGGNATHITNVITGEAWDVTPLEREDQFRYSLLFGRFVVDDADYAKMTAGLPTVWQEKFVFFQVAEGTDRYDFAKALFYAIVDRSDTAVLQLDGYEQVEQWLADQTGEPYAMSREHMAEYLHEQPLEKDQRDASVFRLFWKYMPQFRLLDKNDFVKSMAVFLLLFLFIAIVCFAAVFVVAFTRCLTIALVNAHVYEDLRRLGASNAYLYHAVREQIKRVFLVPAVVGTSVIYLFYGMILYYNGNPEGITSSEAAGMAACLVLIAAVSALLYAVYRLTRRAVCRVLAIPIPR